MMIMILRSTFYLAICYLFNWSSPAFAAPSKMKVSVIKCENKINPLGVPLKDLRFSWELSSPERGQVQKAYQLMISSSKEFAESGNGDVWNSGTIQSNQNILVTYGGKELQPGINYFWRVKVWDGLNNESSWSNTGKFTTGLFTSADWSNAQWIGYEDLADSVRVVPGVHMSGDHLGNKGVKRPVVPFFRKQFEVEKKVANALIFISGLGQYEMSINGKKVGDNFMTPGWTYYDKTCLFNIYDVSDRITNGKNAIGVIVGNGFYNINRERYRKFVVAFGMPKMICKLKITYTDGSSKIIVSDQDWKTSPSPIVYAGIFGGEDYDAQKEQAGWDLPGFDDSKWKSVITPTAPKGVLLPESDYPVKVEEIIGVKKIIKPNATTYLYDFGQNASGIVELKVKGKKGQTVKLIPGELINKDKLVNQKATGGPYYFSYTLKGDGVEVWKQRFTYYGLRYVQVEGAVPDTAKTTEDQPRIVGMKFLHTRNSAPRNGSFECSNDHFNKTYNLINWAIKSNFQSVITDCPHREKLGWLEQCYLMGSSIHFNFDIYNLYKKQVMDMMDAQLPNGLVPDIAPELVEFDGGFRDSPEWGSASVIMPWLIYEWYGDKKVLETAYPMMKKYVDYLGTKASNNILSHGLGDWYDLGPKFPGPAQLTPRQLTATAIYYYDIKLLGKMAGLLNYNEDSLKFYELAKVVKDAFNGKFFDETKKIYSTGSQTAMSMPISVGLVEDKYKKEVFDNLIESINKSGKALTAGDVGFHFLVRALQEGGAAQLVYEMNSRNDVPGYGFQLKKGATALTESWAALEEVSNNHLMLGHVMQWFYGGLAGISQAENSKAYEKIVLKPQQVGDLKWVKSYYNSPSGSIVMDWKKIDNKLSLDVKVPVNTTAELYLPTATIEAIKESGKALATIKYIAADKTDGMVRVKLGSGSYKFEVVK